MVLLQTKSWRANWFNFILIVALISILAPYIAPFDPTEQNRTALLLPPAWYEGGNPAYLLGTDDIGRDILFAYYLWNANFRLCGIYHRITILRLWYQPWLDFWLLWRRARYNYHSPN